MLAKAKCLILEKGHHGFNGLGLIKANRNTYIPIFLMRNSPSPLRIFLFCFRHLKAKIPKSKAALKFDIPKAQVEISIIVFIFSMFPLWGTKSLVPSVNNPLTNEQRTVINSSSL